MNVMLKHKKPSENAENTFLHSFRKKSTGLEVIKLEFILRLKKAQLIGCLRTHVHK